MRIFLHIGLHRTGSTFLQEIYFPLLEKHSSNIIFNDKKILEILKEEYIEKIINNSHINHIKIKSKIDSQINSIISNKKSEDLKKINLILSDENLIPDVLFYKNKNKLHQYLHYLNLFFDKPKILIFIREHSSFVKSQYNQFVKEGYYISLDSFIKNESQPNIDLSKLNYNELIDFLNTNFKDKYYLFKHEFFSKNLNTMNQIFNTTVNLNQINSNKINKSLTDNQINLLLFLEKKFKISKVEKFINKFFSKFINKKIDQISLKEKSKGIFYFILIILKIYNYIIKIFSDFKFSKIIKFINFNLNNKNKIEIKYNFENYENLDKFLLNNKNDNQ